MSIIVYEGTQGSGMSHCALLRDLEEMERTGKKVIFNTGLGGSYTLFSMEEFLRRVAEERQMALSAKEED